MPIRTLNELFTEAVRRYDRPDAFRMKRAGAWIDMSHREAAEAVREVAMGLAGLGVTAGDRVAILSENRVEWALADYAILALGAVNVPIYSTLTPPQVEFLLADSGARVVFVSNEAHRATIEAIRPRLESDIDLIIFDEADGGAVRTFASLRELGRTRNAADPAEFDRRCVAVTADTIASVIYTSGTTGRPKGVVLTHGNITSNVVSVRSILPIADGDSCLSFLPLCHIFERMAGHYTMMDAGATVAYAESVDAVPENLLEVKPTVLVSVPRLYEKMHSRVLDTVRRSSPLRRRLFHWAVDIGRRRSDCVLKHRPVPAMLAFQFRIAQRLVFNKLKERLGGRIRFMVSGGAPLSRDVALFFHAAGLVILEGYGLTETSPVICVNRLEDPRLGTVGQPVPGMEVRIAPDGEILVRGPGVMQGYFNAPEATQEAMADGWFHTGDIGLLDPDGFLTITDRKKDLIVTAGGKNVAPQPIENLLKTDPFIMEAIVVGDRRPYCVALLAPDWARVAAWARAEGIAAASNNGQPDPTALSREPRIRQFLMDRVNRVNSGLAPFETIKAIALIERELTVADGDLTPTLKVKRRDLAARFSTLIESLYGSQAPK
ncbi:MAG TPA: long-chain fatty acid--CoA ligase [Candidatus Eisenbacteria bacterium]